MDSQNQDGFFKIISDGFLTTFYLGKQPTIIDWSASSPTVDRLYAHVKDIEITERNQLTISLSNVAEKGNVSETIKEVKKLLSFFPKNEYEVTIFELHNDNFDLYHDMCAKEPDYYPFHYYPYAEAFLFTQPFSTIDSNRVEYYKSLIKTGNRPLPVILGACYLLEKGTFSDKSNWISNHHTCDFIVDGHHKLLAYKELDIKPNYIRITMNGDKSNFISEYDMLQNIWNKISIEAKNEIISQKPIIILGHNNDFEAQYNQVFDEYLSGKIPYISSYLLDLLLEAITSKDPNMNDWAIHRIDALSKKFPTKELIYLSYPKFNKTHNYLEWISVECTTADDFKKWKTKFYNYIENTGNN